MKGMRSRIEKKPLLATYSPLGMLDRYFEREAVKVKMMLALKIRPRPSPRFKKLGGFNTGAVVSTSRVASVWRGWSSMGLSPRMSDTGSLVMAV